jgi:type IV secretion system protein VirD4
MKLYKPGRNSGTAGEPDTLKGVSPVRRGAHGNLSRQREKAPGAYPTREASSVLSTAISFLTLYRDPIIARNTSQSSFHIKDLMQIDRPVSLYLVAKPVDKYRLKPFVRLFITQVIRRLADEMKFKDGELVKNYKHRLLLMLDEFPSLGRLQVFEEAIGFIAGYGIKTCAPR